MNERKIDSAAKGYAVAYCLDNGCPMQMKEIEKIVHPVLKATIEIYLGITWHDVNEMPDDHDDIIVHCSNKRTYISKFTSQTEWITELVRNKAKVWAYVGDILPARRNGDWFVNIKQ